MRKLVWFTVGFTAACAAGAYLVSGVWLLLFALLCGTLSLAAGFLLREKGRPAVYVCLGLTVAFFWVWIFDANYLADARTCDDRQIHTQVEVSDYSREYGDGICVDGRIELKGRTYKVRIFSGEPLQLQPGDQITGTLHLRYTRGERWSDYYSSAGFFLIGYLDNEPEVTAATEIPARYCAARMRRSITDLLDRIFPADTLAFARALLIGDSSLLDYETDTHLTVSGIKHIIAVSGQHVSILFCVIFAVFGYHRLFTPLIGLPTLLLFAALTGFTPSVNRACIMQALMLLALMFDKEYDTPTGLAFSVLVMLCVNPLTVASVGFQLSAGCIVGMLWFSEPIRKYLLQEKRLGTGKGKSLKARLARFLSSGISVSVSTMIVTAPLCAYYFGMVSLVGILTNLLTLWAVELAFYGIMAACILGAVYLPAGGAAAAAVSWLMRYVLSVSKLLASTPISAVYTASGYIVAWLVFAYLLLFIFLRQKEKHPVMLVCTILLSLCCAMGISWLEPRLDNYRMTVLDVGQGQCILLQFEDKHYMIDCGGDDPETTADLAVQTLLSQGIGELDGIILTHYDKDHAGGVAYFMTRIPVATLYLPDLKDDGTIRQELANRYPQKVCWTFSESSRVLDNGAVQLFTGDKAKSDNQSSMSVLCRMEKCDILITGDRNLAGEKALLEQVTLPDIEILIAGHHGSKNATGRPLLQATMPETAIISVGAFNSYGHPAFETLERLETFACRVVTTADNGTITVRG